ncbi:LpxI family protein [Pelagibacterium montanilacus]|uniref:LpxI family protein n=1 Tax=Pelagibacterium montanilacus TaxID=2185280 RepID=UPI000F8F35E2|nr:UDP-2,3-diacylglucosamine diphosphatase LpxI [Pelagibacterium montanilacus]
MTAPGRLALVVGSGALPPLAIEAALEAGWAVKVLCLHPRDDLERYTPFPIRISRPDQVLRAIKGFGATHVCAVGGMHMSDHQRETLSDFAADGKDSGNKGDSRLSQLGANLLKMLGIPFIGVHEIVAGLLAPHGTIGAANPTADLERTMAFAFVTARRAGDLDLGQALVVSGGRVIATEDIAGTDALLERCAQFRIRGLVADGKASLVLAKTSKPGQPLHVDLPAIGPHTISGAIEAGISGIVIEAGRTLLIDRDATIAAADKAGIALVGLADSPAAGS